MLSARMRTLLHKHPRAILIAILTLSFALNMYGNDFQLGYHSDEPKKVEFILNNTQDWHHPILILQSVRLVNVPLGLHTRWQLAILSRIVMAMYGTLIALMMYKIARQRLPMLYALGVGALTAVTPSIVIHSHYLKEDIAFTFGSLFTILCFFRFIQHVTHANTQEIPWRQLLWLGLAIGITVSAKYKSGILLFALALVPIYIPHLRSLTFYKNLAISLIAGFIVFLLINFPILLRFSEFYGGFTHSLEHAVTGHSGVNVYPLEQLFTFHLRNSILPSLTVLPTLFALGFILYGLFRWRKIDWRDKFLLIFILLFYGILESSPLKPFPGYIRYIMPILPILSYAAIHGLRLLLVVLPQTTRLIAGCVLAILLIGIPLQESVRLVANINQDTRGSQLEAVLETQPEPIQYELYAHGQRVHVKSLAELDINTVDACTLVASSFMYDRYFFAEGLAGQDDSVVERAEIYTDIFSRPYTEIKPAYKSFAFSNPTLRVIHLC